MFEIENVEHSHYRLWEGVKHVGTFIMRDGEWCFDILGVISQDANPSIFPFILKTLENLNNGVVYE